METKIFKSDECSKNMKMFVLSQMLLINLWYFLETNNFNSIFCILIKA